MTHPNEVSKAISLVMNSERYITHLQNFNFQTLQS